MLLLCQILVQVQVQVQIVRSNTVSIYNSSLRNFVLKIL